MKRSLLPYIRPFLFILLGLGVRGVWATGGWGADLYYEWRGGQVYRVHFTRYVSCDAPSSFADPALSFTSQQGCGAPSALGSWVLQNNLDVTPLCQSIATQCNALPNPIVSGVRAITYWRDFDFSGLNCSDFMLELWACCRSTALSNGAAGAGMYLNAGPLAPAFRNRSPRYLRSSPVYLIDGQRAQVALGADDPDGDSLAYALIPCFDTVASPVNYAQGYSSLQPLGPGWQLDLNQKTGQLHIHPLLGGLQQVSLAIEMREYRNGTLISTYRRDVGIQVLPGQSITPTRGELGSILRPAGLPWRDTLTMTASIGAPLNSYFIAFDPDADSVRVAWSKNISGAEFFNAGDPAQTDDFSALNPVAQFRWNPQTSGRRVLLVEVDDPFWCGVVRLRDFTAIIDTRDTSLLVAFPQDTLRICQGDTLTLSPQIFGLPPVSPLFYTWNDGSHAAQLKITRPGTYTVLVTDTTGTPGFYRYSSDTLHVLAAAPCIWPGDADGDGIARNFDALAIGLAYGKTGPSRPNAAILWRPQQGQFWGDTLPGPVDMAFADTNGDGIVNMNDTLAISLNYGLNHFKNAASQAGPVPLFLQPRQQLVQAGDTLSIDVILGTPSQPADSVYGIAFTVSYDPALVDTNSARLIVPDSSWLGRKYISLFSLQKDNYANGALDVAISRMNQQNRQGQGQIARVDIIMIDDITGKQNQILDTLELLLSEVRLVTARGIEIPVQSAAAAVTITSTDRAPEMPGFKLYPNPAKGTLWIEHHARRPMLISLFDLSGKRLQQQTAAPGRESVDISALPAGLYILRADDGTATAQHRLVQVRP